MSTAVSYRFMGIFAVLAGMLLGFYIGPSEDLTLVPSTPISTS